MGKSGSAPSRWLCAAWLFAGLVSLAGCGGGDHSPPTVAPLAETAVPELVVFTPVGGKLIYTTYEALMKTSGLPVKVTIMEGLTTDLTVQGLKDGVFDLIFMLRSPRPDEGIEFFEILRADVALYTHPQVGVENLSTEQIAAIFSGEITNWSQVGGADQHIVLFVLPDFDSATEAFRAATLGDTPFDTTARTFPDEPSVIRSATRIAGGIGFSSLASKNALQMIDPSTTEADFHVIDVNGISPYHPGYPISIVIGFGYLAEQAESLDPIFEWAAGFLDSGQGRLILQLLQVDPSTGR